MTLLTLKVYIYQVENVEIGFLGQELDAGEIYRDANWFEYSMSKRRMSRIPWMYGSLEFIRKIINGCLLSILNF
jgi:hypothetical protein